MCVCVCVCVCVCLNYGIYNPLQVNLVLNRTDVLCTVLQGVVDDFKEEL